MSTSTLLFPRYSLTPSVWHLHTDGTPCVSRWTVEVHSMTGDSVLGHVARTDTQYWADEDYDTPYESAQAALAVVVLHHTSSTEALAA